MAAYRIMEPEVEEAIERRFIVEDRYFDMDIPTYVIRPMGEGDPRVLFKRGFEELALDLRPLGYLPKLNRVLERYTISIYKKPPPSPRRYSRNLILLLATSGTIFLDGYLRSNNPILTMVLMPGIPPALNALLFTAAILGIFGLHELGHKLVAVRRRVEASMPYFIPAPPGMGGTFGAVITQREPPINRDALFDLGLCGPLVGFLVTVGMATLGIRLSFVVPVEEVSRWMVAYPEVRFQSIPFPPLMDLLASLMRPTPPGMVLILHPVAFAAWVGCIVTFINLMPSWQLDGGHITRALLGEANHKIVSVVGILLLLFTGYFIMAIVLAFFMMRSGGEAGAPLDDISPLSASRKLLSLIYPLMMLSTMVVLFSF